MSSSVEVKDRKKEKKDKKDKRREKEAEAATSVYQKATDLAAEERRGTAYRPPPGSILLSDAIESEVFDYDTLKEDDDLELWIIRVPDGITPKHLNNQQIPVPSSSHTQQVGTLSRKNATYDIWSVRPETFETEGRPPAPAGGDETLGLTCLVPRKKKDSKLYTAPKSAVHHLVLSTQPALPTPPTSPPEAFRRYCHPQAILKHRFLPAGSALPPPKPAAAEVMDLDVEKNGDNATPRRSRVAKSATRAVTTGLSPSKEPSVGKPKKRKADVGTEASKKAKKAKS